MTDGILFSKAGHKRQSHAIKRGVLLSAFTHNPDLTLVGATDILTKQFGASLHQGEVHGLSRYFNMSKVERDSDSTQSWYPTTSELTLLKKDYGDATYAEWLQSSGLVFVDNHGRVVHYAGLRTQTTEALFKEMDLSQQMLFLKGTGIPSLNGERLIELIMYWVATQSGTQVVLLDDVIRTLESNMAQMVKDTGLQGTTEAVNDRDRPNLYQTVEVIINLDDVDLEDPERTLSQGMVVSAAALRQMGADGAYVDAETLEVKVERSNKVDLNEMNIKIS